MYGAARSIVRERRAIPAAINGPNTMPRRSAPAGSVAIMLKISGCY
jgi:hypothetical protein